ncbi:hypothetical protein CNEO3_340041 [Clostridium neonatale]|uniref:hypothetical protein n=1 Tax=Clostridium neonatale TaxID=137838 RepID=UPI00291C0C8A|nr:hypothetical protein [Clostridium neonatale]CAI3608987.1 hypothetical protein CNEO3_470028 [Clostridium neonatale]CAI3640958.1 hypothetical protein CNEO4_540073 [Clostridium neonatale]CAI3653576.1 hypothetical protein CNEO3_340041 [Clostridium neonatale]CAI3660976.1 hypothetical protein CNEO3_350040 [Clostridium neonatale]CAI3662599.1 hypothetical protein CNEO3_390039 [Clostridium neonatale]
MWGFKNAISALTEKVAEIKGMLISQVGGQVVFKYANDIDKVVLEILERFTHINNSFQEIYFSFLNYNITQTGVIV